MPRLLKKETIESIYASATDILATVGVEFELESALELFKKNGAKVDGKKVFISSSLLEKALGRTAKGPIYTFTPQKTRCCITIFQRPP